MIRIRLKQNCDGKPISIKSEVSPFWALITLTAKYRKGVVATNYFPQGINPEQIWNQRSRTESQMHWHKNFFLIGDKEYSFSHLISKVSQFFF